MKKNSLMLVAVFFMAIGTQSQTLSKSIIATQGGFDGTEQMTLEWTLGENIVETVLQSNIIYTQGFHQPSGSLDAASLSNSPYLITVSPNPVKSWVNVQIPDELDEQLNFNLYDVGGRFIMNFDSEPKSGSLSFDLRTLPSGIYILKISNSENVLRNLTKLIKY